jgi:septal ring factor EnvC (AmiA/AmiB activator)
METNNPSQVNDQEETYLNGLLVRISGLEKEQKLSRDQIQRLAADKKRIKEMLHNLAKEKNNIKNRHEQQESMNASLIIEIQNKSLEEKKLRQQVEHIQKQAEEEIERLKEERDAALALIERKNAKQSFRQQYSQLIFVTILMCVILLSVSIWLLI